MGKWEVFRKRFDEWYIFQPISTTWSTYNKLEENVVLTGSRPYCKLYAVGQITVHA